MLDNRRYFRHGVSHRGVEGRWCEKENREDILNNQIAIHDPGTLGVGNSDILWEALILKKYSGAII